MAQIHIYFKRSSTIELKKKSRAYLEDESKAVYTYIKFKICKSDKTFDDKSSQA